MKLAIIAATTVAALAFSPVAYAGSKNTNNNSSSSSSGSVANSRSSGNTTTFNDRLQAPGLGSFGGGVCPEGLMASGPGFGLGFQVQCKEGKRQMKYQMVRDAFGKKGTQRWMCETDKELYTLDECRALRMSNARRK
jgi:hypothetical protein